MVVKGIIEEVKDVNLKDLEEHLGQEALREMEEWINRDYLSNLLKIKISGKYYYTYNEVKPYLKIGSVIYAKIDERFDDFPNLKENIKFIDYKNIIIDS